MSDKVKEQIFEYSGAGSILATFYMKMIEWFNIANINDLIILLTGLGGLVFLFFKIKSQHLDSKIKEEKLNSYKKDKNSDKV